MDAIVALAATAMLLAVGVGLVFGLWRALNVPDPPPVVVDRFTDARFRRVVRKAGFPLCLDGDECGEKRCGCWMMSGPEAVAAGMAASESVSAWRYGEMVRLRAFSLALADRIHAAHEVLGRLAERRAVTISGRDSCPLG